MKRATCYLLLLLLLLPGCAAKRPDYDTLVTAPQELLQPPSPAPTAAPHTELDDGRFTLLYSASDSLNPYSCRTERNRELCPLLYETLVSVTQDFRAEPALCSAWESSDGGKYFTLTIRDGAVFSDGSEVTNWDVLYSLNRAQESDYFKDRLNCISGASVTDNGLLISLREANPSFPLRLDIPVVKEGSGYAELPIGSGRYTFEAVESGTVLTANRLNPENAARSCGQIYLSDVGNDAALGAFQQGQLDFLSEMPGEKLKQGFSDAVRHSYPTTVLVFLMEDNYSLSLEDPARRRLVNSILDRGELAAILGGEMTLTPLHPQMAECDAAAAEAWISDDLAAYGIEILTEDYDGDGMLEYMRDGLPTDFLLKLGVCSENESSVEAARAIISQLERAGVETELHTYDRSEFESARKKHSCDLYLARIRLTADFDLTELAETSKDGALEDLAEQFRSSEPDGRKQIGSELCAACAENCRLIPLAFCRGAVYSRTGAIINMEPTYADLFRNLKDWELRELAAADKED